MSFTKELHRVLKQLPDGFLFAETTYITASVTRSLQDLLIEKKAHVRGLDICLDFEPKVYEEALKDLYNSFEGRGELYLGPSGNLSYLLGNEINRHSAKSLQTGIVLILDPYNVNTLKPFYERMGKYIRNYRQKETVIVYNTCERRKPGTARKHASKLFTNPVCLWEEEYGKRFGNRGPNRSWSIWVNQSNKHLDSIIYSNTMSD